MLKLILADNQAIFRAGIAKVLAVEDEMRIVAQAQTPEQMFYGSGQIPRRGAGGGCGLSQRFCGHRAGRQTRRKTRVVVVLADTGRKRAAPHGERRPWRGLPQCGPARRWSTACAKVARGETLGCRTSRCAERATGKNDMVGLRVARIV